MDAGTPTPSFFAAWKRWFIAALLVVLTGLAVPYSHKVLEKETNSAIMRWRPQLLEMEKGEDIWKVYTYPNPPIMAVLLLPFAKLPPLVCALGWFFVKVALALASFALVFRLVETPERPFPDWAKALTVLLSIRPIMGDLTHGNVNIFILFLVVLALYAYRQGKDYAAGLALALSIACKVTPALFIPYFIWKRSWKALGACAAGMVVFLLFAPGLYFGQQRNVEMLGSWANEMVKPFLVEGVVFYSEHNNQSIPGLVFRLATHSPSFSDYVDDKHLVPLQYHNVWELEAAQAQWIIKGCMLVFAGLILWTCRTPDQPRQGWRLSAEFGLVILGMLLFSERTWKHHCVTLMLPIAVIAYYLATVPANWRVRSSLAGSLALATLFMATTSTFKKDSAWDTMAKLAQTYGAYVWAYLVFVAALVYLLRRREEPQPLPSTVEDAEERMEACAAPEHAYLSEAI